MVLNIKIKSLCTFLCCVILFTSIAAIPLTFEGQSDEVTSLPGLDFSPNFHHYSGYLSAPLDSSNVAKIHYWFFESQSDQPESDPVVLWLNGGPGCSSLFGALGENGPLHLNDRSSQTVQNLTANKYAWNRKVNLLYLESPAGVGFSYYNKSQLFLPTTDDQTSIVNFEALNSFYKKFPQYLKNDFYLTGESYAGFYLPTLAMHLLDKQFPVNFQGIAIGDGLLTWSDVFSGENQQPQQLLISKQVSQLKKFKNIKQNLKKSPIEHYLSIDEVKKALHIDMNTFSGVQFEECSYDVHINYASSYMDMAVQLKRIINSVKPKLRMLLYHGEVDPLIPWEGNKEFIDGLGFKNITGFVPWSYDGKLVGQTQTYEKNFTFTTFYDAGHMVPIDSPAASYQMIDQFLFK